MLNLRETFTELDLFADCFINYKDAIKLLLDHGLLKKFLACEACRAIGLDRKMRIDNCSSYLDGQVYRCGNKKCRAKKSLKNGSMFGNIAVEYHKILRAIYCWVYNYSLYQAIAVCKVSENTYISIKDILMERIARNTDVNYQIGGTDVRVQFDETAICNGRIITDPSNTLDTFPGIQWLVGGVVEGNCREFILELVPNRQSPTFEDIFRRRVRPGSIIITDGYPSYPSAVRNFGSTHEVVNHSIGFVNVNGDHTNQIENLWSHFKQEYRARGGINRDKIILFIKEFTWKKTNIINRDQNSLREAFIKILEMFKINV